MGTTRICETCEHFHGLAVGKCAVAATMTSPTNYCDKWEEKKDKPIIGMARPEPKEQSREHLKDKERKRY